MKLDEKGVTLVELIIVIAIISLVTAMSFTVIHISSRIYEKERAYSNNQMNIRHVSRTVSREIRRAESIIGADPYSIKLEYADGSTKEFSKSGEKVVLNHTLAAGTSTTSDIGSDIFDFNFIYLKDPSSGEITDIYLNIKSTEKKAGSGSQIQSKISIRR